VALLWLAFSTGHQLSSNEQGIVTTFGKYTSTIGPGMNFTAPWPIQRVRVEDVTSIRRDNVPEGEAEKLMLTGDQSLVDLSYIIRWNIRNLKQFTYQLEDPQGTVREVAEAAMRASVAEVKLNDVMLGTRRAEIETNVRQRMQAVLDAYHSGILVQGVDIKKADPPAKVNDAFQRVQAAQQDANRDMSNARAYAEQVIQRAEATPPPLTRSMTSTSWRPK
jgi:membrane protease subunit HflK